MIISYILAIIRPLGGDRLKKKVKEAAGKVGMINVETGQLKGYIPEEFNVWVPPKRITHDDQIIEPTKIIESEDETRFVFLVPHNWASKTKSNNNMQPFRSSALKQIGWERKENTTGLLDDFLLLEPFLASEIEEYTDLDPVTEAKRVDNVKRSYLEFAKKWGPLWISDNPSPSEKYIYKGLPFVPWVESIEVWSDYALKVKTALIIAILLNRGDSVRAETWHELYSSSGIEFEVPENVEEQRKWFAWFFNMQIFNDHEVSYCLDWSRGKPEIRYYTKTGFLSAVWFQLLQAITLRTLCLCDGCRKAYDRESKPKKGQNNYCKNCRNKAPKNDYYHRNSDKINEQRRLKRQQKGVTLQEKGKE